MSFLKLWTELLCGIVTFGVLVACGMTILLSAVVNNLTWRERLRFSVPALIIMTTIFAGILRLTGMAR